MRYALCNPLRRLNVETTARTNSEATGIGTLLLARRDRGRNPIVGLETVDLLFQ